jgi:predicted kinase
MTLIIFGGLPGTGKTTLARRLAHDLEATFVRIDTVEQALRRSANFSGAVNDAGYRVAYAVAEDNLRAGRTVVADSVNPLKITRDAWRAVATAADARAIEIEVICSNIDEHRHRVETRQSDIPGLAMPTWQEVTDREYEQWERARLVIDTAGIPVEEALAALKSAVSNHVTL